MKLYVGNLSFQTTESDLRGLFSSYGTVKDATVMMDRTSGRSRGFGFVTMETADAGRDAISGIHDRQVEGRRLTVNEARPREDRPSFSGSRR